MIGTYADIRTARPVADNMVDEKRLLPYITEVQKLYLIPAFGAALYLDIDTNIDNYATLLKGGYYDENKANFVGLSEAIGYLAYSRFVRFQNVNPTAYSMVNKLSEFSEPLDPKTITATANDAEKIGLEYLNQCVTYLRFIEKITCDIKPFTKRRFKTIGL
jgi:hypothetical protein